MGNYHLPREEDLPNTSTSGGSLIFLIRPHNLFRYSPDYYSCDRVYTTQVSMANVSSSKLNAPLISSKRARNARLYLFHSGQHCTTWFRDSTGLEQPHHDLVGNEAM
ncbi:unnamed protein product [Protopolystoma xenopodis]|uniref:Uncharacterized protein n=1 Tax=Protopolystoma xenopodis TaxID=117903 RepID=A0A448WD61_9PLAT|nr:unnamed protein product [Protopolystoma xenopodis]